MPFGRLHVLRPSRPDNFGIVQFVGPTIYATF